MTEETEVERLDSTGTAYYYISTNTDEESIVPKVANERKNEAWRDNVGAVEDFIEDHGDEIAVVERWESFGDNGDTVLFVHYWDYESGGLRAYDTRQKGNMDDDCGWFSYAATQPSDSDLCFMRRDEAFEYVGHEDPNDGYGEGLYGATDTTLTIGGDSVESHKVTEVEDITFEATTPDVSGTHALNTLYSGSTYEFSATFESDFGSMGPTASDVLRDTADTVEDKHGDYGHAIEKVAAIKGILAVEGEPEVVELDDGREAVVMGDHTEETFQQKRMGGIITRLLDKVCRGYTLQFQNREDNVGEKLRETWSDAAGYCGHAATGEEDG